MFEKYYALYEECKKIKVPTYKEVKKIQNQWDKLTLELFENFDIKDITDMWTLLSDELCNRNNYFENFVSSLDYYSDRMNLNRWCRLQLLLGNAINQLFKDENK